MRVVKLKRFLCKQISLFSRVVFVQRGRQTENREFFLFVCRQKTDTHADLTHLALFFFNNNNTYIYTHTHTNALFFSLSMTTRTTNKRRSECSFAQPSLSSRSLRLRCRKRCISFGKSCSNETVFFTFRSEI